MVSSAAAEATTAGRPPPRLTLPRALVILGVLVAAYVVAQNCQQSQVRVTKEQAIATAKREVDFTPRIANVRLLRQGLSSRPFWFVNLSAPGRHSEVPRRLSVVKIDANTGKVEEVDRQR
jgi:hypothetical protein